MIGVPLGVRVWIATGHTDMRRGMNSLALQVSNRLEHRPHLRVLKRRAAELIQLAKRDLTTSRGRREAIP
jgi:transposase